MELEFLHTSYFVIEVKFMSRRDEIIDAVINILTESNFREDFSMSTLAKRVNIGKSTIYEYFQNKDEVLKASLMKFIQDNVRDVALEGDVTGMTFEDLFKGQVTKLLDAASNSRVIIQAMQHGFVEKFPPEMRLEMKELMERIRAQLQKRFISYFEKGITDGVMTNQLTFLDGYIFMSLIVGSIITFSDPKTVTPTEDVVNKLYETIIKLGN